MRIIISLLFFFFSMDLFPEEVPYSQDQEKLNQIILVQEALVEDLYTVLNKDISKIPPSAFVDLKYKVNSYLSDVPPLIDLYFQQWYSILKEPNSIKIYKKKYFEKIKELTKLCNVAIQINQKTSNKNLSELAKPYLLRAKYAYEQDKLSNHDQSIKDYRAVLKIFEKEKNKSSIDEVILASFELYEIFSKEEKHQEAINVLLKIKLDTHHEQYGYYLNSLRKGYSLLKNYIKLKFYSEMSIDFYKKKKLEDKNNDDSELEGACKDWILAWLNALQSKDKNFNYQNIFDQIKMTIPNEYFFKYSLRALVLMRSSFLVQEAEYLYKKSLAHFHNNVEQSSLILENIELKIIQKLSVPVIKDITHSLSWYGSNLQKKEFADSLKDDFEDKKNYFLELCSRVLNKIRQDVVALNENDKASLEDFSIEIRKLAFGFKSDEEKSGQLYNIAESFVERKKYQDAINTYNQILKSKQLKDKKLIALTTLRKVVVGYALLLEKSFIQKSFSFIKGSIPAELDAWIKDLEELNQIFLSKDQTVLISLQSDIEEKISIYNLEKVKILLSYENPTNVNNLIEDYIKKISADKSKAALWILWIDLLVKSKSYEKILSVDKEWYAKLSQFLTEEEHKLYINILSDSKFSILEKLYLDKKYPAVLEWIKENEKIKTLSHHHKQMYQIGSDAALATKNKSLAVFYLKKLSLVSKDKTDLRRSILLESDSLEESLNFEGAAQLLIKALNDADAHEQNVEVALKLYQLGLALKNITIMQRVQHVACRLKNENLCKKSLWAYKIISLLNRSPQDKSVPINFSTDPASRAMKVMLDLVRLNAMDFNQRNILLRDVIAFSQEADDQLQSLFFPIFIEQFKKLALSWSDALINKKIVSMDPKGITNRIKDVMQTQQMIAQARQLPWVKAKIILWATIIKLHYKVLNEVQSIQPPPGMQDVQAFKNIFAKMTQPLKNQADKLLENFKIELQKNVLEASLVDSLHGYLAPYWLDSKSKRYREDPQIFLDWLKESLLDQKSIWVTEFEKSLDNKNYSMASYIIAQAKVKNIWNAQQSTIAASSVLAFMGAQPEAFQLLELDPAMFQKDSWMMVIKTALTCSGVQGGICKEYVQQYKKSPPTSPSALLEFWMKKFNFLVLKKS